MRMSSAMSPHHRVRTVSNKATMSNKVVDVYPNDRNTTVDGALNSASSAREVLQRLRQVDIGTSGDLPGLWMPSTGPAQPFRLFLARTSTAALACSAGSRCGTDGAAAGAQLSMEWSGQHCGRRQPWLGIWFLQLDLLCNRLLYPIHSHHLVLCILRIPRIRISSVFERGCPRAVR